MAKAKKLPSGSWRVRVFSHTDENGKKHRESFTAPTKAEAEMMAAEWAASKKRRARRDLTVGEAVDGYISAKEGVLSPSTVRGYVRMARNNIDLIKNKHIRKITSEELQVFVSDLAKKLSPKTVANVYNLVSASIAFYSPDIKFRVTLPAKRKVELPSPSDEDVQRLYNSASPTIKLCIALAAFGGFRRGEICALKYKDVDYEKLSIHVHADMIQNKKGKWLYKEIPKTAEGNRTKKFPKEIIDMLGTGEPEEFIVKYASPGSVDRVFLKLKQRLDLPDIRLHDLRHYFASIGAILIPDIYLAKMGGWKKSSNVMKEVYQNNIVSMEEAYEKKMTDHFERLIQ